MDLIEVIGNYRFALRNRGRNEAQTFLDNVGVHSVIQEAIIACFNDQGDREDTGAPTVSF